MFYTFQQSELFLPGKACISQQLINIRFLVHFAFIHSWAIEKIIRYVNLFIVHHRPLKSLSLQYTRTCERVLLHHSELSLSSIVKFQLCQLFALRLVLDIVPGDGFQYKGYKNSASYSGTAYVENVIDVFHLRSIVLCLTCVLGEDDKLNCVRLKYI